MNVKVKIVVIVIELLKRFKNNISDNFYFTGRYLLSLSAAACNPYFQVLGGPF